MQSALPAAAVDLVLEIEDRAVARVGRRDDDGAGAVAEEHARRPILVVDDARHDVGADDQRVIVRAGRHELAGRSSARR